MAAAAARAQARGVRSMVGFNYRRVPALALARQLVAGGRIGDIRHVRASYLQDWLADPAFPLTWRLQREHAGSGALGDLGAHIVDLAQYLTGAADHRRLRGDHHVRDRAPAGRAAARPHRAGHRGRRGRVHRPARTRARWPRSRRPGSRPAGRTRCASSSTAARGSLAFDLERLNELEFYDRDRGRRRRPGSGASWSPSPATRTCPPGGRPGTCWAGSTRSPTRSGDLVTAIAQGTDPAPSFADGLQVQRVLDAVADSAASRQPVDPGRPPDSGMKHQEPIMSRPFTLFTGQWADLPLEEVCRLARDWGYDGLELACWGDHFEVDRALRRGRLPGRAARAAGEVRAALLGHLQPPGRPGGLRPPDRRSGTRPSCPPGSGATASPKACGSGPPPSWPTPPGPRPRSGCRPWSASPAPSIWHTVAMFPPVPPEMIDAGVRGLRRGGGTRSWTCSTPRASGSRTRCTPARSPTTSGPPGGRWTRWATGPRSG